MEKRNNIQYNRAKSWQMGFFALNNTASNMYLFMMGFVSYYATGIAGLLVLTVSTLITSMRIWDGFTDPIIGFLIDRTDSKYGKFRPFMLLGNLILAVTTIIIFKTTHLVPQNFRLIYFILFYALHIIGYTFQTAVTKSAQTVLTNDPKQRPVFTIYDAIFGALLFGVGQVAVSSFLVPKHGGFTMEFFNEFLIYGIIISGIMTILAVFGIWKKDRTEFFGIGDGQKLKIKDYWPVIKENRALQMLIVAASTDKLTSTIARNSVVGVMLYGILMGNYELSGMVSVITLIPSIILIIIGVRVASKFGQKKALVLSTWGAVLLYSAFFIFLKISDLTTISLSNINITTILFLLFMIFGVGFAGVAGGIVIPMIADCSDYETYRSGKYVPGLMGTVFSFVDKLVSSLAATIVGLVLVLIGYKEQFPQVGEVATPILINATLFLAIILPILGWVASLIAMKFYPLDDKMMERVQGKLQDLREENLLENVKSAKS